MAERQGGGIFAGTTAPFRVYYSAVIAIGAAIAYMTFPSVSLTSWVPIAMWVAFVVIADMSAIELHGGRAYIAVSSSLDYAAIVLFGPAAAAIVSVIACVVTQIVIQRRPADRVLFNICVFIITITAAGLAFEAFGGRSAASLAQLMLPIAACGLTYFAVNTLMVSAIVGLWKGESPWRVWQSTYAWTLTHLPAFVPLGALMVVVYRDVGFLGVGLFLMPLILARYVFKLYTEMREEHIMTIRALTSAIDASDPFTAGHSRRVAKYSVAVARKLGVDERRVTTIELASLVHDIGKIGVDNNVLMKVGKLSDGEWQMIRSHPARGAGIVKGLRFLGNAEDVVLHHHERFDGKGYPHGIAGDEIPLESRIVNVVDAFDAMMSDRPYRKSMGLQNTLTEVENCSGKQFDPQVVSVFIELISSGKVDVEQATDDELTRGLREYERAHGDAVDEAVHDLSTDPVH